jgi:cysteinyl-tRNA synthetase
MNITDVGHLESDADEGEDKMEKAARKENKDPYEIANFYTHKFYSNFRIATQSAKLGVKGGNHMYQKKLGKDIRCHPDLQLF